MAVEHAMPPEHAESTAAAHDPHAASGVLSRKLGIWVFLISEIFFFSGLIGGSAALRASEGSNWPTPGEVLNIPLTSLNTFILIVSSVAVVMALQSLQEGNQRRFKMFLVGTVVLGITFLSIQGIEYYKLIVEEGLTFDTYQIHHTGAGGEEAAHAGEHAAETVHSVYGTTFYIQTGFHGAHVTGGVIWLLIITFKAFLGSYSAENYQGIETFGLYWHFVDLVWILLFTIVYLV